MDEAKTDENEEEGVTAAVTCVAAGAVVIVFGALLAALDGGVAGLPLDLAAKTDEKLEEGVTAVTWWVSAAGAVGTG